MTTKEAILKAMQQLPEDASYEEAIDRLYVLMKVEKGRAAGRAGEKVSLDEARKIAAQWRL
jgi:hypothetical protein